MINKLLNLKRSIFILMLLCFCASLQAQDLIVKKNGEVMAVYNIDIAEKWVYYTLEASTDDDLKRLSREDVFSVKIGSGDMQLLSAQNTEPKKEEQILEENFGPRFVERKTADNNDILIAKYNRTNITGVKMNEKSTKLTGPSDKETDNGVAILRVTESSVLSNEDIEIQISLKQKDVSLFGYEIFVKNKTDKAIYVDLANTFRNMNNGESKIYFDDTQVTKTTGGSTGAVANLGAIASGIGIGGAVGTIASGINVGAKNDASVSQTYKNDRIIKIPPMGKVALPPSYRASEKEVKEDYDLFVIGLPVKDYKIKLWNIYNFTEEESPWRNHISITYSSMDNFSTYSQVKFSLYLGQIIGSRSDAPIHRLVGFEEGVTLYSRLYMTTFDEIKDAECLESYSLAGVELKYY